MPYLLGLLVVCQILDGLFTRIYVGSGLIQDMNPLVAIAAQQNLFLVIKIAGAGACAALLWLVSKRYRNLAMITAGTIAIFYAVILSWNLQTVLRLY